MKFINIFFAIIFTAGMLSGQCFDPDAAIWQNNWASCQKSQNPIAEYGNSHWIQYDFGSVRRLSKSWVWNTNDPAELDRGFKKVKIDYSTDGIEWTNWGEMTFPKAAGDAIYGGFPGPDMSDLDAQFVILTALSNHGDAGCSGLAEMKFNLMPGFPNEVIPNDGGDDDDDCAGVEIEDIVIEYVSATEAFIYWEVSNEYVDLNFIIEYRIAGANEWEELETDEFELFAEDLEPGTTYEFRIAIDCGDEIEFSSIQSFTTADDDNDDEDCLAPNVIWIQEMFETEALIGWEEVPGAEYYLIEYRVIGADDWEEDETDEAEIFIEELEAFTIYEFRIGVECADYSIKWSEINNFITDPRILPSTNVRNLVDDKLIRLYPNPTKGRFVFQYQSELKETLNYSISNMNGSVLIRSVVSIAPGENRISIDLSRFPAGTYLLKALTLGERKQISKKILKVRE